MTYKPSKGFSGTDRFTYTATSANGTATDATVTVTVGKEPAPKLASVKLSKSTVRFTLNEPASVTLTFSRRGHKSVSVEAQGQGRQEQLQAQEAEGREVQADDRRLEHWRALEEPAKLSFKIA